MLKRTALSVAIYMFLGLLVTSCGESNEPPTVSILLPSSGETLGATVQFEIEVSDPEGEIASIEWDFGDGSTSSDENPSHTYEQSNAYNVQVVVTDAEGESASDRVTIDVEIGPRAIATVGRIASGEPVVVQYIEDEAPLQVEFDGLRSRAAPGSSIESYHWDFGTGDESDEPNPRYVYREPGEYQAVLTVTDDQGRSSQARVTVRVISYEAINETLELAGGEVSYELHTRNSRETSTGPSMFYQYVVRADRILEPEEAEQVLIDIVENAQSRWGVARITVQLFSEEKEEMMIPREYAHYIGSAAWARDAEGNEISTTLNTRYFNGTGKEVYGFTITEELIQPGNPDCGVLCSQFRIGIANILIQSDDVCREILDQTIDEIASWRLISTYQGYLAVIYDGQDATDPIAWISGVRGEEGPELTELPYNMFAVPPPGWNTPKSEEQRVHYADGIPSC